MNWFLRYSSEVMFDTPEQRAAYFASLRDEYLSKPEKIPHGTSIGYGVGDCRCSDCTKANTEKTRDLRKNLLPQLKSDPDHELHGTYSGAQAGCRCGSCSSFLTNYNRDYKSRMSEILKSDPGHPWHGTISGYSVKCRCEKCKTAQSIFRKEYNLKVLKTFESNPDDPKHGTRSGYSYGCKCAPCLTSQSEYMKEYSKNRKTSSWNERYAIDIHSTGELWHPDDDYIFNHPDAQSPVMLDPKEIIKHYIPMHTCFPKFKYPEQNLSSLQLWREAAPELIPGIHSSFSEEVKNNGIKKPIMVYHSIDRPLLEKHPGVVFDGHHRLLEAIRQGIDKVPVSFIPAPKKDIEDRLDIKL